MKQVDIVRPIFVFGCCNSGTKILWESLKQHAELCGPDIEGQDLQGLPSSMRHNLGNATFRLWAHPKFKLCYYATEKDFVEEDEKKIKEVYSQFLESGKRFITKSPPDSLRARLIQAYFPGAFFVAVVRNGYAVSEGIVRKRKFDPERPKFKGLFTTIEEAAEQWFRANTVVVSQQKFLKNYLIIKYEELVENPKKALFSILDFCDLERKGFPIPSFDKNLNEKQISRLSDYEIEAITRIAAPMLEHFEYRIRKNGLKW